VKRKKSTRIGVINPNLVKSRDLVHLQEILNGTGCGSHKGKKDIQRRTERKQKQNRYSDVSDGSVFLY
jgi:hypothetical protein